MVSKHSGRFIAYYRVSTQRQGRSGLGLEAQQRAVLDHLNGGAWRIVAEFTEIESGKRKDRPKLAEALAACRVHGAKLIIAKLDRLARNVAFISTLMDSGVDFEAADFPQANRLTIHILAAVAEHEARMISERTKAALAAAKRRGVKLGGIRNGHVPFTAKVQAMGVKARAANVQRRAADLQPILAELQAAGFRSFNAIAVELNARSIPTMSGTGTWQSTSVSRLLARLATEHCLFATLGKTTTRPAAASLPTHFEALRGEHSEKPEKFYEIVRAPSYPPYGEGNQRKARVDFTNLMCPVAEAPEDYRHLEAAELVDAEALADILQQLPRVHAENAVAEPPAEQCACA